MSLSAAVVAELVRAGLDGDALIAAVERIEAADGRRSVDEQAERRRAADRERKARLRNSAESAEQEPPIKKGSPHPSKEINPQFSPPSGVRTIRAREDGGFDQFWEVWPNKVNKPAAVKAWPKAVKAAGSLQTILEGVHRYVENKPLDRQWCNPASFLNGERWNDQPAPIATGPPRREPDYLDIAAEARRQLEELERNDDNRTDTLRLVHQAH